MASPGLHPGGWALETGQWCVQPGLVPPAGHQCCLPPLSVCWPQVVEPLVRDQWFVKMEPLAKPALAAVANGDISIVPDRFEKIYNHWLENIRVRVHRCVACSSMIVGFNNLWRSQSYARLWRRNVHPSLLREPQFATHFKVVWSLEVRALHVHWFSVDRPRRSEVCGGNCGRSLVVSAVGLVCLEAAVVGPPHPSLVCLP